MLKQGKGGPLKRETPLISKRDYLAKLASGDLKGGDHVWVAMKSGVRCKECGITMSSGRPYKLLARIAALPCQEGEDAATPYGVHPSHKLRRQGAKLKCAGCGGTYFLTKARAGTLLGKRCH